MLLADLLEYVVVHEMIHLIEPTHSERFIVLLSAHYPGSRREAARADLNELPLAAEAAWKQRASSKLLKLKEWLTMP